MGDEILVLGCVVVVFLLVFRVVHAATAAVKHAKRWREYNFFVKFFHTKTEIHVFIVEKETLVESVKAKKECARNSECGATYPGNRFHAACLPEFLASRYAQMVSDYFNESHRYAGAPTLRCFRFDEKFHTDDTEGGVLIEEMCDITQSSREESCVGIETDEDIASRAFGPAVDGGAKSAVF